MSQRELLLCVQPARVGRTADNCLQQEPIPTEPALQYDPSREDNCLQYDPIPADEILQQEPIEMSYSRRQAEGLIKARENTRRMKARKAWERGDVAAAVHHTTTGATSDWLERQIVRLGDRGR